MELEHGEYRPPSHGAAAIVVSVVNKVWSMSFVDYAIDLSWQHLKEFGTKFQKEVSSFLEIPEFPYNTV